MENTEKIEIANALIDYGGGFEELFGKLLIKADIGNAKRLLDAFPEMIEKAKMIIGFINQ